MTFAIAEEGLTRVRLGIAILGALVVVGCTSSLPVATPVVAVPTGGVTRMTPKDVEALVIGLIHGNETTAGQVLRAPRIVSITAEGPKGGVLWEVRAEGTFTTNRFPPGASPGVATTGHYTISDSDGGVITYGFP